MGCILMFMPYRVRAYTGYPAPCCVLQTDVAAFAQLASQQILQNITVAAAVAVVATTAVVDAVTKWGPARSVPFLLSHTGSKWAGMIASVLPATLPEYPVQPDQWRWVLCCG